LKVKSHPDLIVGLETGDDAGVFRINDTTALIQTLDFLTPVTNSPYEFGQVAAANALSDVYAMGGVPLTAMNIVCFPQDELDEAILQETLQGGIDKIEEAGATLVGGHSVNDPEFKYGLSVTGVVHPDRVLTNRGSKTGEVLILTKPLGVGILATAVKGKLASEDHVKNLVKTMIQLNKTACEILLDYPVSACTDVTGFGLAGHLLEMARGSKKTMHLFTDKVPAIEGAKEYAIMGLVPGGTFRNRSFCSKDTFMGKEIDPIVQDLIFDPQTSGGLLFSIGQNEAETCVERMHQNGVAAAIVGKVGLDHSCGNLIVT
jgi:selenide,water dikinase